MQDGNLVKELNSYPSSPTSENGSILCWSLKLKWAGLVGRGRMLRGQRRIPKSCSLVRHIIQCKDARSYEEEDHFRV